MGFVSDLLAGSTLLEVHQVRRIMEPVATGLAAKGSTTRIRGARGLPGAMETAETMQAFIDSDTEFHRMIVMAAGNTTLASLIQGLSGGMLACSPWRTIAEEGAVEITKKRHIGGHLPGAAGTRPRARERCRPDPPVRRRGLAASRHRERRGARDGRAGAARARLPAGQGVTAVLERSRPRGADRTGDGLQARDRPCRLAGRFAEAGADVDRRQRVARGQRREMSAAEGPRLRARVPRLSLRPR